MPRLQSPQIQPRTARRPPLAPGDLQPGGSLSSDATRFWLLQRVGFFFSRTAQRQRRYPTPRKALSASRACRHTRGIQAGEATPPAAPPAPIRVLRGHR